VFLPATPQQPRRVIPTPRGGPIGSEITVNVTSLPPMIGIQIGFGNLQQHQIVGRSNSDGEGVASVKVRIPGFADRDKPHFFFVTFADTNPRGVSDAFHVTADDGTARVSGEITAEGKSCTVLRTARNDAYVLLGDVSEFKPGARVSLRGTIADGAPCGDEGIPIAVSEIRAAL
jgi:hypothetical protein